MSAKTEHVCDVKEKTVAGRRDNKRTGPEAQVYLAWMEQNKGWVLGSHWVTEQKWDMI